MFFLVSLNVKNPNSSEWNINDTRCFGYFSNKETALKAVNNNWGDMEECIYNYLVIEELPEGIHPTPPNLRSYGHEIWFNWENDKWTPTERPACLRGIFGFALG